MNAALAMAVLAAVVALVCDATMSAGGQIRIVNVDPAAEAKRQMPKGTARIAGTIVDGVTARPLAGATVTLTLRSHAPVHVLADATGRFAFDQLPAGRVTLSATLMGYAPGAYDRLRPAGAPVPIDLAESQQLADVSIAMWPFGAIGGTVSDGHGDPIVGAAVHAYRRTSAGGRWQTSPASSDTTDDRGEFRIASLEPGTYVVAVPMTPFSWPASLEHHMLLGAEWPPEVGALPETTRALIGTGLQLTPKAPVVLQSINRIAPVSIGSDGSVVTYATQFFAGAASLSESTTVAVRSGESRLGVDFVLRPITTTTVSGVVSATSAVGDLPVRLVSTSAGDGPAFESALSITDGLGRFTFAAVPEGEYSVRVLKVPRSERSPLLTRVSDRLLPTIYIEQPELPREPVLWAEHTIVVGPAGVSGVTLPLQPGITIRGRVEFTGASAKPSANALPFMALGLDPADGGLGATQSSGRGRVEPNGQFATLGVPAGRYFLRVANVPAGWFLQSALVGSRDISIEPVELTADVVAARLTFTDQATGLAGHVTTAPGARDAAALVVIFPAEPGWRDRGVSPRRLRGVRTDRSGAFSVADLPGGRYLVAAIAEVNAGEWQSPDNIAALTRIATPLDLGVGEMRQLTLQTTSLEVR